VGERKALILRIDPELWDELRRWADTELRSLNAQIEFVLRRAVSERRRELGEGRKERR
jgi:hypothetical protein